MLEAVIFDRDGVIIDSEAMNINSSVEALKELGVELTKEDKKLIIGRHPEDYGKDFLKKYDFSFDKFRELQKIKYGKFLKDVPFFEKTILLIKSIHDNKSYGSKILLGIATSSNTKDTMYVLEKEKLSDFFDAIVCKEDHLERKPHPEVYLTAAKKLGVVTKNCVAIEDTYLGLESAKCAGMKCIVIPNEYTKDQDFSKADLVVNSADEITMKNLNALFKKD